MKRMSVGPHSEKALFTRGTRGLNESFVQRTLSRQREATTCLVKVKVSVLMEEQKELLVDSLCL